MDQPLIVILAVPHLFASIIARTLGESGDFDTMTPNLERDDWEPVRRYPLVVTTLPVPRGTADVLIELPPTFDEPVVVTIGDVRAPVSVDPRNPIVDLANIIRRSLPPAEVDVTT